MEVLVIFRLFRIFRPFPGIIPCVVPCCLGHLLHWLVVLAISDIWCLLRLTGYSPLSVPQFISQSALIDCCPDTFWWIVCEYYLVLDIGNLWSRVFKMFQSLSRHHWYNQNHTSLMVAKQYQNWPLHYENKYIIQKFVAKLRTKFWLQQIPPYLRMELMYQTSMNGWMSCSLTLILIVNARNGKPYLTTNGKLGV